MSVQWPLHVDGAVEYAGPLVGVEGRVVIVADIAHRTQIVAAKIWRGKMEKKSKIELHSSIAEWLIGHISQLGSQVINMCECGNINEEILVLLAVMIMQQY